MSGDILYVSNMVKINWKLMKYSSGNHFARLEGIWGNLQRDTRMNMTLLQSIHSVVGETGKGRNSLPLYMVTSV